MDEGDVVAAASAIHAATHLIVAAGAGFSADSGLPVYADVAKTPQWRQRGLDYGDLCQTSLLLTSPECGYGFWVDCARAYREASPHVGYSLVDKWMASKEPSNIATYTSNVDGHFRRFPSLSHRLCEIHGCAEEWACGASMGHLRKEDGIVPRSGAFRDHNAAFAPQARPDAMSCSATTFSPSDEELGVLAHACRGALASSGAPGTPESADLRPSCEVRSDGAEGASALWHALPPRCPCCAAPLRPCVLMFGDEDPALLTRLAGPAQRYQEWEDAMEAELAADATLSLVVLELGCGERVPSVRIECEDVVRDICHRGGRAMHIRVNAEGESEGGARAPPSIAIQGNAATVLERIDAIINTL